MIDKIGTMMVRKRVAEIEAETDAKILAVRKARRAKLLAAARPKGPSFALTWFRGHRTVVAL